MNREFNASSKQARAILAVLAILASTLVLASIEGLSGHYNAASQWAGARSIMTAQR